MTDYLTTDPAPTSVEKTVEVKSTKADDYSGLAGELPFDAPTDPGTAGTKTAVFTFANGELDSVAWKS